MAEPIEMPFGVLSNVGPGSHVLDEYTYGRHLANTVERSVLGGHGAVATISIATCCFVAINLAVLMSATNH